MKQPGRPTNGAGEAPQHVEGGRFCESLINLKLQTLVCSPARHQEILKTNPENKLVLRSPRLREEGNACFEFGSCSFCTCYAVWRDCCIFRAHWL